jgi:hypothetical protein
VATERDSTAKPAQPSDEAAWAFIMSLMQASTSKKTAIASVVQFDEATESSIKRIPSIKPIAAAKAEAKVTLKTIFCARSRTTRSDLCRRLHLIGYLRHHQGGKISRVILYEETMMIENQTRIIK